MTERAKLYKKHLEAMKKVAYIGMASQLGETIPIPDRVQFKIQINNRYFELTRPRYKPAMPYLAIDINMGVITELRDFCNEILEEDSKERQANED